MIDLRYVKKLVEMLDESSVDSIEISDQKGEKIRLSKTPQQRGAVQMAAPMQMPVAPAAPAGRPTAAEETAATEALAAQTAASSDAAKAKLLEVKSPMVGTFYRSPEPGAKPYVSEGQRIEKGQILCIIEAMKIMNEIESEYSGTIREIPADDAHPVEYGEVLFRIEP